uniref:Chlorohydrolase n=1 Tax=Meloidogyne hapla TaxID=6305 RepID=A0A1I8B9B1_MELHA
MFTKKIYKYAVATVEVCSVEEEEALEVVVCPSETE